MGSFSSYAISNYSSKSDSEKSEDVVLQAIDDSNLKGVDDLFGCASEGNAWYRVWRGEGYSHREARSMRRAYVRKCRGNAWSQR